MAYGRRQSIFGRKIRIGRNRVPVWVFLLFGILAVGAAAGQAVGPVLTGGVLGSAGVTVEQALVSPEAPTVTGANDAIGTVNDEGTSFTVAVETNTGRRQTMFIPLYNESDAEANGTLQMEVPRGIDVEVEEFGCANEAQVARDQWLFNIVSQPATSTDGEFVKSVLDDDTSVGQYTSTDAVDTCTIYISYTDAANTALKLAKSVNGGVTFSTRTVDTGGVVGQHTSIDAVNERTIYISYYDTTNGDLLFAKSTDGGATFATSTIDSANNIGFSTSIAAPDLDTIYISYWDSTNRDLLLARSTDAGATFATSTVDAGDLAGRFNSLTAPNTDTVFISYKQDIGSALNFAKSTDGGMTFATSTVDSAGSVGDFNSIDAVDTSNIFISYRDLSESEIQFAKSTDGGVTFSTSTVDSFTFPGLGGQYTSIDAVDVNTVFIGYSISNLVGAPFADNLKFAESTDGGASFTVSTVDADGPVGQFTSISAVDASNVYIAYHDAAKVFPPPPELNFNLNFARRNQTSSGLNVTVEPKDDIRPGFYTVTGRIIQTQ